MKRLCPLVYVLASLGGVPLAAAQLAERPLPPTRPVGIIFQSEVGRTTSNSLRDDEVTQAAIAEVEQTLRRLGYEVVPRADVIQKLIGSGINCPSGVHNCEPAEVLKALDLGGVVLVAVWWDRTPADITVEVTSADAVGVAKGKLDDHASRRVPALVTAALQDLKNGRAVDVQINTLPVGAEVRLDGELIGMAPVSAKARPGRHEVVLTYPDYVTTSHHFEVPRGADDLFPVHVSMERTTASAARAAPVPLPPPTEATPAWDYALGTGLALLGTALVVTPVLTLVNDDDCEAGTNNVGCERVHFGWRAGLQTAGGVLALSGSVLLFATTPIRASLSTDGETVHAQLHGSF